VGAGSLMINFFCGSKKVWSAGSSVGRYQPTERSFCRFFCFKNEKIFLAKMRAMKKIFCGSKNFFGGEFLVKPKRGLALLAPCNGVLNVL